MLRSLTIKNFAVIDEQTLTLSEEINALTGETGAGKSILIEALGFLLGARGSSSWLRAGAQRLEVIGAFDQEDFHKEIRAQFKIMQSPVLLRRELDVSGKTRAWINSQGAPLSILSALGNVLVDFHGQHEHQTLLQSSIQLELLDRFVDLQTELKETAAAYEAWSSLRAESGQAKMSDEERRLRIETCRFQLQELNEANLRIGEEEELEAALPLLKNAERLKISADAAYELLYEQEGSISAGLFKVERAVGELSKIDAGMKPSYEQLEAARLSLEDVTRAIGVYRDHVEINPGKLDAILARQEHLSRLKKKYGLTIADMLAARERVAAEFDRLENSSQRQDRLEAELKAAAENLETACSRIHKARLKAAAGLERKLLKELKVLGMPQARFSVSLEMEEGSYSQTGADGAEFMLAANPGESLKPVKDIASGGELSRVMLALKTVLAQADRVPILVFDEVDAGIGGIVARAVGRKLSALGESRQVLCVTHLPQVACCAHNHYQVVKEVDKGRTLARVERLDGSKRLDALALMLGGRQATAASRKHAQELLESSLAC